MEQIVEVSKDALGFLLVYSKDRGEFRAGDPVGKPDYYDTKGSATRAATRINHGLAVAPVTLADVGKPKKCKSCKWGVERTWSYCPYCGRPQD